MIALPALSAIGSKLKASSWLLPWVMMGVMVYVFLLRPNPNEVTAASVQELTTAVNTLTETTTKLAALATKQQEWVATIDSRVKRNQEELAQRYSETYGRFDYAQSDLALPLDALYAKQLLIPTEHHRNGELRDGADGVGEDRLAERASTTP